ncbi:MAG: hypothetical protein R2744_09845 [Bacteroidales bacterium]
MLFRRTLTWVIIFSIAMGFLESAVVVYIRELLYPGGFDFPLVMMDGRLAVTEIAREAATILMLLSVAWIAGRNFTERFGWFLLSFAVWDIFYYIFLYLLIGWPQGLLVWDVLFLIPVTWTGPVISPLLVCIYMISLAIVILVNSYRGKRVVLTRVDWLMLVTGAAIIIVAFSWDYSRFILNEYSFTDLWNLPGRDGFFDYAAGYVPVSFNWVVFTAGSVLNYIGYSIIVKRVAGQAVAK